MKFFLKFFSFKVYKKKVLFKCPKENLESDTAGAEIIQTDNVESVSLFSVNLQIWLWSMERVAEIEFLIKAQR